MSKIKNIFANKIFPLIEIIIGIMFIFYGLQELISLASIYLYEFK